MLEVIQDFEGMDAAAFWHDVKFSLRHLHDFSRLAIAARAWLMWPEGAADI